MNKKGKFKLEEEVIKYTEYKTDLTKKEIVLTGVKRGIDGTTKAEHDPGITIDYYILGGNNVLPYVVAHEAGHNLKIGHDSLKKNSIMTKQKSGYYNHKGHFRHIGFPLSGKTTEQLRLK